MWLLFSAVLTASLLGSAHCVGMCGPLSLWATGTSDSSRSRVVVNAALYHLGRMITYVLIGCLAGNSWRTCGYGRQLSWYSTDGGANGRYPDDRLWRVARFGFVLESSPVAVRRQTVVGRKNARSSTPLVAAMPSSTRPAAVGLLTALLPCGWLYLFAFVASGTADPVGGAIVMFAFWAGTLPLLIGLVMSASLLKRRFQNAIPVTASLLMIVSGWYVLRSDALASTESILRLGEAAKHDISALPDQPLPCCQSTRE